MNEHAPKESDSEDGDDEPGHVEADHHTKDKPDMSKGNQEHLVKSVEVVEETLESGSVHPNLQEPSMDETNSHEDELHCKICQTDFLTKGKLRKHIKIEHENVTFQCKYCKKKFLHRRTLTQHIRLGHAVERAENDTQLSGPDDGFEDIKVLIVSNSSAGRDASSSNVETRSLIKCRNCTAVFTSIEALKEHSILHNDEPMSMIVDDTKVIDSQNEATESFIPTMSLNIAHNVAHYMHGTVNHVEEYMTNRKKERGSKALSKLSDRSRKSMWTKHNFPGKFKSKEKKSMLDIKPRPDIEHKIVSSPSNFETENSLKQDVRNCVDDIIGLIEIDELIDQKGLNIDRDPFNSDQWDQEQQNEDLFLSNFLHLHRRKPVTTPSSDEKVLTQTHRALHEESYFMRERQYVCKVCSIAFEEKLDLWNHHTEDHSLVSVTPQRSFIEIDRTQSLPWVQSPDTKIKPSGIVADVMTVTPGIRPESGGYVCTKCDQTFKFPYKLHNHILECASDKIFKSMRKINHSYFGLKKKKKSMKHKQFSTQDGFLVIKGKPRVIKANKPKSLSKPKFQSSKCNIALMRNLRMSVREKQEPKGEEKSEEVEFRCKNCLKLYSTESVLQRHRQLCGGKVYPKTKMDEKKRGMKRTEENQAVDYRKEKETIDKKVKPVKISKSTPYTETDKNAITKTSKSSKSYDHVPDAKKVSLNKSRFSKDSVSVEKNISTKKSVQKTEDSKLIPPKRKTPAMVKKQSHIGEENSKLQTLTKSSKLDDNENERVTSYEAPETYRSEKVKDLKSSHATGGPPKRVKQSLKTRGFKDGTNVQQLKKIPMKESTCKILKSSTNSTKKPSELEKLQESSNQPFDDGTIVVEVLKVNVVDEATAKQNQSAKKIKRLSVSIDQQAKERFVPRSDSQVNGEDDEDTMEALLDGKAASEFSNKKKNTTFNFSTTCSDCHETFLSPYLLLLHQSTCQAGSAKKSKTSKTPKDPVKRRMNPDRQEQQNDASTQKVSSEKTPSELSGPSVSQLSTEKIASRQTRIEQHMKIKKKRVHSKTTGNSS